MPLAGHRMGVTAGPTRAWIDPVRYLANASTGRLGIRIAEELAQRGARVDLVLGAGVVPPSHREIAVHSIETVPNLEECLRSLSDRNSGPGFSCWIHSMAVLDYIPQDFSPKKLSSREETRLLSLERTPKVIGRFREWFPGSVLVGFKLETTEDEAELRDSARMLRDRYACDLVVANGAPFENPEAHAAYFFGTKEDTWQGPYTGKDQIARELVQWLEKRDFSHVST